VGPVVPGMPQPHVSRAVESIREDPIPGESVPLLVEVTEAADVETVRKRLAAIEGVAVEGERPLDTLVVEVPHERVEAVCRVEWLAVVETAGAAGIDVGDAGEDVEPE